MDALCDPSLESATLYGCRSCKCVFLTEQAFLKHIAPALINVFPPLSYNQTGYVCHWVGCNRVFTSYGSFHTHILEDHMDSTVAPFCFWRCCTNNLIILDDHVQLLRHVLLHAFIEARLHYTKRRLLTRREGWGITCSGTYGQKISVNIRTADRLLWQPDILRDGFSCRWIGCNVKSNSAQLYMEHVLEHAGSDLLETRNFVCDWNVAPLASAHSSAKPCGRSVSRLTHLRTHLYRHTGLPRFICDRCRVCFCEFDTFKEHFAWSIPNAPKRATSHEDCDTPRLKVEEECAAMNNPGEADDSILRCPGCGKAFVTKHRLLAHKRTCRCIKAGTATAPSPKRTDMIAPVDHELPPQRKGDHARVVTIDQLAGNTLPTNRPEPTDRLFCCAVPNCDFASTTQSTYMRHFKRYHTSGHPDGIWYACHICTHFHVRRAYTLSHHLRRMHGLEPQSGKMRFAYAADSEDGIYRMIGRTKPIPTSQRRLLPYPPPSSAT
ncbi:unnamed protein product [Calicophoron daubneyi]|uniref:C2H2-type domain-containing protein n=1 Tax=Calicophoron daubneyi TaxID=300641 RepID=A0AAV2TLF5_CALDB